MEKEGFIRTVKRLDEQLELSAVSTDRHIQIKKLMDTDERFTHLIHQFDPWHMAKNINKKLTLLSKQKGTCSITLGIAFSRFLKMLVVAP